LDEDPGERFDRSEQFPEMVAELQSLMDKQMKETDRAGTFWD
jgi:hypothetical protein